MDVPADIPARAGMHASPASARRGGYMDVPADMPRPPSVNDKAYETRQDHQSSAFNDNCQEIYSVQVFPPNKRKLGLVFPTLRAGFSPIDESNRRIGADSLLG